MDVPLATVWSTYTEHVVEQGNQPILFMLIAFGVTFGITRFITHSIRTDRFSWLGNVEAGDTHIHHLVWGISLLLVSGLVSIALQPPLEVTAIMFGIGAALTLDEFALWLHLEDVYWSEQGRQSIDAVIVFTIASGFMLVGVYPLGIGSAEDSGTSVEAIVSIAITISIGLFLAYICFRKGKLIWGVVGIYIQLVGFIGALRLAKPESAWARKHYDEKKMKRAHKRYAKEAVKHPPADLTKPKGADASAVTGATEKREHEPERVGGTAARS
ncbi:MAG: hypothetical protein U0R24_09655 [Solirubrobacterales bacterium]